MLKSLVNAQQATNFILIEDSIQSKGDDLFLSFLKNHAENQSVKQIDLFCYEQPPCYYSQKFEHSKIKLIDGFVDPQSWISTNKSDFESNDESVVFIDSLSPLLLTREFNNLYKKLFSLSHNVKKIVALFHGDVITNTDNEVEKLKFLSTTNIKIIKVLNVESKIAELTYKKPGGKVIRQREKYVIDSCFSFSGTVISDQKVKVLAPDMKAEMKNLATFELGLNMSEAERIAKSNLVLPYMRNESSESESGRIIYEADAGDDLEEDPDDDLDI